MAIVVVICLAMASVAAVNIWWFTQPSFEQPHSRLDINTASVSELTALPGIDVSTAERIITERPYNGTDDLVQKNIITQTTYDKVKDQIVAKQK